MLWLALAEWRITLHSGWLGRKRGTSLCVVLGWLEAPVEWKDLRDQWT